MPDTIGLIGLGAMGRGMAQSLRRAGFDIAVHDVRTEAAEAFAQEGGRACATLPELGANTQQFACRKLIFTNGRPSDEHIRLSSRRM